MIVYMESFRVKQLKRQLDTIFGESEAGKEMKHVVLKAQTTGFTPEEIEQYKKQREEDLAVLLERFSLPYEETIEGQVIYGELISNNIEKKDE